MKTAVSGFEWRLENDPRHSGLSASKQASRKEWQCR